MLAASRTAENWSAHGATLASQTTGFDKPGGYVQLLFQPGTEWAYSDSGPNWLAECITLACRRDVDELMFERISPRSASSIIRLAKGSDKGPMNWTDDAALYTAYGDARLHELRRKPLHDLQPLSP